MKKNTHWYSKIIYGILVVFSIAFLVFSIGQYKNYTDQDIDMMPRKIEFNGSYQGADQTVHSLEDGQMETGELGNEVTLKGHFTSGAEANTMLFFRLYHVGIKMYQNGTEVYSYGVNGGQPNVYHSLGDLWDGCILRQSITPEDTIEFVLTSPGDTAEFQSVAEYNYFLDNIYSGSWSQMIRAILVDNAPHLLLAFFLIANGVALWLGAMALKQTKMQISQIVFNGSYLFLIMGLWMLINGHFLSVLTSYNGIILSLEHILLLLTIALVFRYIGGILESRKRQIIKVMEYTTILMLIISMGLQMMGIMDGFEFLTKAIYLILIMVVVTIVCLLHETIHFQKKSARYMLISVIIPVFFMTMGILDFLFISPQDDVWTDIGIFIFTLMQLAFIFDYLRKKFREAEQAGALKLELAETKNQMMIAQIRPHFVFNTLNAISALCLEDPIKADEAIVKFSKYLRANITVLEGPKIIRFEQEVELIKNYVAIEQMRFHHRVLVDYQIDFTDFSVPMLSIQPIVENAIKHGIAKKKEGGKVVLQSIKEGDYAVITVWDDGVGFDVAAMEQKEGSVGMRNIQTRLRISGQARVTVESVIDEGTRVTVRIPLDARNREEAE